VAAGHDNVDEHVAAPDAETNPEAHAVQLVEPVDAA